MAETASPTGLPEGTGVIPGVERRIALSRLALAWERVWPALWPALGIAGLYLGLGLFGLWFAVPLWLHTVALYAAIGGTAIALLHGFWRVRLPTRADGVRRLERTNGLAHRPLSALDDRPAAAAAEGWALWALHRAQMLTRLTRLSVAWPSPAMAARDPNALRVLVGLLVAGGLMAAGGDAPSRLAEAFTLSRPGPPPPPVMVDAWITPPAYTARPPIFLPGEPGTVAAIEAPEGSVLVLRVQGSDVAPRLSVTGAEGEVPAGPALSLADLGGGVFEARGPLESSQVLALGAGPRSLAEWRITVLPDDPPVAAFAAAPGVSQRNAVVLNYTASDDYGVTGVELRITLDRSAMADSAMAIDPAPGEGDDGFSFAMPVPPMDAERPTRASKDLTSHPWAGLPVLVRLDARDAAGQTGSTAAVPMVLPERAFRNALARALIEQRKALILSGRNAERVADMLAALMIAPERYFEDTVLYLGMRAAERRLRHAAEPAPAEIRAILVPEVVSLLYDLALRAEDGGLSLAEQRLRELMRQLSEALQNGAPDSEIEQLMAELKDALAQFLAEMAQRGGEGQADPNARTLSEQDFARMLEAIEEMSRQGARDSAQDMLSELQSLLDNLQAGGGQPEMSPGEQAMAQALQGLGDLIGRQRGLMDQTFREQQETIDPRREDGPQRDGERLSQDQEQLREDLERLLQGLREQGAEVPDQLGEADQNMGSARDQLGEQEFGGALDQQQQAIDRLRQGAESLARELMQGQEGQGGQAGMGASGREASGRDPLGRESGNGGGQFGNDVRVPDERDLQRARDLLEELQRRSGDRSRPPIELDYIERLLRRF